MATVLINNFNGGQAEDYRTFSTNQQTTSTNFDCLTDPHFLSPYRDQLLESTTSGTITDYAITDIDAIPFAGANTLVALGRESSVSSKPQFFVKNSSTDMSAGWLAKAVGLNSVVQGSLVVYKDFAYCLGDTGAAINLQRYDSNVTVTTIGTSGGYGSPVGRPFVHPEDNVLYYGAGNIVSKYDGTTHTPTALTLPNNKVIVSICNYGSYLAIACRPKNGLGSSTCYLWGRDTTLNTLQGSLDLGPTQINFAENIGNVLYFVSSLNTVGAYNTVYDNRLIIKGYVGGAVTTIKTYILSSSLGTALNIIHAKRNDKIYFGFSNDTAMYVFGKNKEGDYFMNHDRGFPTTMTTLYGISLVGDALFTSYGTASTQFFLNRSQSNLEGTVLYTYTSSYTTTINPNMALEDRYRNKQLEAIGLSWTGTTTGSITLKVVVDGGSSITLLTSSGLSGEQYMDATVDSTGVAIPTGFEYTFTVESTGNQKVKEIRYRYTTLDTMFTNDPQQ